MVHRSDGSGTTYIFTDYLSKVSPDWKTKVGQATSVELAGRAGRQGQRGRDPAGQAVRGRDRLRRADLRPLQRAPRRQDPERGRRSSSPPTLKTRERRRRGRRASRRTPTSGSRSPMRPGAEAYPISSFTWLLIHDRRIRRHAQGPRRSATFLRLDARARRPSAWRPTSTTPRSRSGVIELIQQRAQGLVTDPLQVRDGAAGPARDSTPAMTALDRARRSRRALRPPPQPSLERSSYSDRVFKGLLTLAALAIPVLLGFLVFELWGGARLAIGKFGFDFVTTSTWDPVAEQFGAFPLIFGTLVSSLHRAADRRAALARRRDLPHRVRAQGRSGSRSPFSSACSPRFRAWSTASGASSS